MGLTFNLSIISIIITSCVCFPSISNYTHICPDYGEVEFAKVKTVENYGHQIVHIECDPGYQLEGRHKLLCISGQWEAVPRPVCIPHLCPNPPPIVNGALTFDGEKDGVGKYKKSTLVTYDCNDGYILSPPESKYRVCEFGIWTGTLGKCVPIGCKPPKEIENGYYVLEKNKINEEFSVGQRVYYSCNPRYILNGDPNQQCIDDGSWSPRIPPVCILENSGK